MKQNRNMTKCKKYKIQTWQNTKGWLYRGLVRQIELLLREKKGQNTNCQNTNVTKYKCNKMQKCQNTKGQNTNVTKYKRNKIQTQQNTNRIKYR